MGCGHLTLVAVNTIPTDSIARALVVFPAISRRKHSKPNSARDGI